ncbi:ATP-NAD kinase-like domain-containing protein [Stachybotrys elegans]|uniref:ATP-NAD kinase-like domain-containing protein n=1 Tax=Stachybotrys elegans TaxID=80388 RepID=A0A8K0T572_9HYPO|nr:ATP-NAD kinase-like domain-containing protein [Stachybotrys elegans]
MTSPTPSVRPVSNIRLDDGSLTWDKDAAAQQLRIDQLLFVLPPTLLSSSKGEYIICALREDADNKEQPFRLVLLSTAQLPDFLHPHLLSAIPSYLRHSDNRVHAVVSTNSGLRQALPFWESVLQPLWSLVSGEPAPDAPSYHLLVTESAQDVPRLAQQLWVDETGAATKTTPSRTVVLLTGDGGVVDLLNGSKDFPADASPIRLAILPMGTGNALFHSMHIPLYSSSSASPLVLGLRTLFSGTPAPLPIFRADFSPGSSIVSFTEKTAAAAAGDGGGAQPELTKQEKHVSHLHGAIVASYGFHSSLVYESDTPEYRVHGDKRFRMVAEDLLRDPHAYAARISFTPPGAQEPVPIPGDKHGYMLVAGVSNMERTFTISPDSKPLDGKLRLVHFGPMDDGKQIMDIMMAAYADGKHVHMDSVTYKEVQEVKVEMAEQDARWRNVCIDGTIVEVPQSGHMTVKTVPSGPWQIVVDSSLTTA